MERAPPAYMGGPPKKTPSPGQQQVVSQRVSAPPPPAVQGAPTKKPAEPRTAMVRCTAVPDTPRRCELIPTSPSWFPVVIRVPTRSPCYPKSGNRARLKPECHGGNEAQG